MPNLCVIGVKAPWSDLKRSLEHRGGGIQVRGVVSDTPEEDTDCVGELDGATYIVDSAMGLVLGSNPDLWVNISKELSTEVVVFFFETVSGTYSLLACARGDVRRYYFCSTGMQKDLSMGAELPTEASQPLADPDGLVAAAEGLGFDIEAVWHGDVELRHLGYPDDCGAWETEESPAGLAKTREAHHAEHSVPSEQNMTDFKPELEVQFADDGSITYDIKMTRASSVDASETAPATKSWFERLTSWLSGQ